ncbi:MAG: ParB/RepB/Spo0J family partition protein [Ruminococcus sp.]|jgi:ParB family chromosome partitioning protein|nr:ParB/RepB/Spo0J family partition protein [Ruminococcus sp.]
MKKGGLGAGLSALFEDNNVVSDETPNVSDMSDINQKADGIANLPLDSIIPDNSQPRKDFEEQSLVSLAESIRVHGVLQPIVVRPLNDDVREYKIVAGERRYRASKMVGLPTIPAVVRDLSDFESSQLALIENLQREDLTPTEIAVGYKNLIDNFEMTQEELSKSLGISRSQVANYLRLLTLPEDVFELLKQGRITVGHAKVLLSINDRTRQSEIAVLCADDKMTVRALERLIKENSEPKKEKSFVKDEYYTEVEHFLQNRLGRKVVIGKKSITIEFSGQEDLGTIIDKLS